jgi:hypothetical protein
MSSDSEDDIWHNTCTKYTHLLLTPDGQDGMLIPMTTGTRLPFSYRLQRIQKNTVLIPQSHPSVFKISVGF